MTPAPVSRRRLLAAAPFLVVGGCTRPPGPAADGRVAAGLAAAWAAGDRDAFLALFHPAARTLGVAWVDTWRALARVEVGVGADQRLEVVWRVAAEPAPSVAVVPLQVADGRVVGVDWGVPEPVWLRSRAVVAAEGTVGVLSAAPEGARRWVADARVAAGRVVASGLAAPMGWAGDLLVEVPADAGAFGRRDAAVRAGEAAAFTVAQPGRQSVVVVDPGATAAWAAADRRGLLTHEAVHAATRSPLASRPLWVTEGAADWVALPFWPAARERSRQVLAGVGDEAELPGSAEFGDPASVEGAYARAEAAFGGLVAAYGVGQVSAWLADWEGSPDLPDAEALTRALRAELARRR